MKPKTLILYLSLSGNTRKLANKIASMASEAEVKEISLLTKVPSSKFGLIFKFGLFSLFKIRFKMKVPSLNMGCYDRIAFGAPVWMGKVAGPFVQAIKALDVGDKKLALFVTHNGDLGRSFEEFKWDLNAASLGAELEVKGNDDLNTIENLDKINTFITNLEA